MPSPATSAGSCRKVQQFQGCVSAFYAGSSSSSSRAASAFQTPNFSFCPPTALASPRVMPTAVIRVGRGARGFAAKVQPRQEYRRWSAAAGVLPQEECSHRRRAGAGGVPPQECRSRRSAATGGVLPLECSRKRSAAAGGVQLQECSRRRSAATGGVQPRCSHGRSAGSIR